jgi:hypothetical protein
MQTASKFPLRYPYRISALFSAGVALWPVAASAQRIARLKVSIHTHQTAAAPRIKGIALVAHLDDGRRWLVPAARGGQEKPLPQLIEGDHGETAMESFASGWSHYWEPNGTGMRAEDPVMGPVGATLLVLDGRPKGLLSIADATTTAGKEPEEIGMFIGHAILNSPIVPETIEKYALGVHIVERPPRLAPEAFQSWAHPVMPVGAILDMRSKPGWIIFNLMRVLGDGDEFSIPLAPSAEGDQRSLFAHLILTSDEEQAFAPPNEE